MSFRVFRDGRVHVQAEMCPTCIFRPGNLMHLNSGRLRDIVGEARAADSTIVCHATLGDPARHAACRGFFDLEPRTTPLQVAERLGMIEWQEP